MVSNPYSWAALAALVVVTLALKGYIRLPKGSRPDRAQSTDLPKREPLDSNALGLAYVEAKRIEVELENRQAILAEIEKSIKERLASPFAAAAPADPSARSPRPQGAAGHRPSILSPATPPSAS